MTIKPGAFRFNTDSMKLEIFRGADTGVYNNPIEDVVAYSGTSLFWDDSPIGAFTLSNNNRTATTNDGNSGSYTNGDVYSTSIAAGNTYAWTLRVTNGDTTGGWYFTDSQTASNTHADQRNESSGNASGLRGGETGASTYGDYATANGTSSAQNQIAMNSDVSPNGNKNIEFVVYRPGSGTGKVWIRAEGAGSWIGGGDPSNTSSTATIVLPDATTYFGFVQYDRDPAATFTLDIESSGGYYGPRLAGQWEEIVATSPEIQTGGTRGLCAGGFLQPDNAGSNTINLFNIASTGNASDFGDLTIARYGLSGCSSRVRGLFGGGRNDPPAARYDRIDEVTIASTGAATDYGDLDAQQVGPTAFSNSTRGVWAGGYNPAQTDKIQYVTIAVKEDAIDFGNLTATRMGCAAFSNGTRGIIAGGQLNPGTRINIIEFVTISTQGNAADFGDLTEARRPYGNGGCSNAVRGLIAGGVNNGPANSNVIDYITIATLGNALDFGDLLEINSSKSGCASATRGVWSGGQVGPTTTTNSIEYVQIMSTGNAVDFGDIQFRQEAATSLSNGHGGL